MRKRTLTNIYKTMREVDDNLTIINTLRFLLEGYTQEVNPQPEMMESFSDRIGPMEMEGPASLADKLQRGMNIANPTSI